MQCFLPGQSAGDALFNSLTAKTPDDVPAGRLPFIWPKSLDKVHNLFKYLFHVLVRQNNENKLYLFIHLLSCTERTYGKNNGTLHVTVYIPSFQVPPITDYHMEGRTYRYSKEEPLYPFGYGLSYTQFQYESVNIEPKAVDSTKSFSVTVIVKNTGSLAADEVRYFSMDLIQVFQITSRTEF